MTTRITKVYLKDYKEKRAPLPKSAAPFGKRWDLVGFSTLEGQGRGVELLFLWKLVNE